MLKWVDLAEICISEPVIFQNNWKFDTKLDRMFEKSILKHFVDPSITSLFFVPSHPHQNLDLSLEFLYQVPISQNIPSRTKKYQKFHPPPIFPGSLTRSQVYIYI